MTLDHDISRTLSCLAVIVFLSSQRSPGQGQIPFGRVSELPVGSNARGMIAGDFDGDKRTDLAVYSLSQLTLLHDFRNSSASHQSVYRIPDGVMRAASSDLNRDGIDDVVLLVSRPLRVRILMGRRDTLLPKWDQVIPAEAENMIVRDINNDRKQDILLFGKKSLGMTVLLGNGDGTFGSPRTLLEDHSLSTVILLDLNGDRIEDVIAFDWVTNEVLLFSGIGSLRFGTPSSICVSNGLADMFVARIDTDANLDLVLLQQDPPELRIFRGDGLGNFSKDLVIPLSYAPSKLLADDLDGDGRLDIIVFSASNRTFSVFFNDERAPFSKSMTYAAGNVPVDLKLIRRLKEKTVDLVILDAARRSILRYHSANDSLPSDNEQTYAVGLNPRGIDVLDVNNDGNQDIAVINNGSQSLSIFLNRGNGTFTGQLSLPIDPFGESVHSLRANDSTFFLLTEHPQTERILITRLCFPSLSLDHYSISTNRSPQILEASYTATTDRLSLLVTGKEGSSNSIAISEFQQVEGSRFLEKPFFSDETKSVLAANVIHTNHGGIRDVVYLSHGTNSARASLYLTSQQQDDAFSAPHLSMTLPDTGVRDGHIWGADLNGDPIPDLILQFHSDDDYLLLLLGKSDSSFTLSQRFNQVAVKNQHDIALVDIDGDGVNDIVLANALAKTIQVFLCKKGGVFFSPKRLLSFSNAGGFVVSDLNKDGTPDYAVVYSESGMLKVFLGKE